MKKTVFQARLAAKKGGNIFGQYFEWRDRPNIARLNIDQISLETSSNTINFSRVAYQIGIFRSVSVGISRYLPYQYRRKTRSVHFGIKKGAIAPFFPQKGGNGPLFDEDSPPFEENRGERYEKGGDGTDRKYRYRANLIPGTRLRSILSRDFLLYLFYVETVPVPQTIS